MRGFRRAVPTVLLALAFAACGDAADPLSPSFELTTTDGASRKPGDTTAVTTRYALRHATTAPALSAYHVSFWAVRGQERSVTVRYGVTGPAFLTFTVPRMALDRGTDGRKLAAGDSVRIDLWLDPTEFREDFEPTGLQFSNRDPAILRVWHGNMDPDVDRDGDVDGADQAVVTSGMTYYHVDAGSINWHKVSSLLDPVAQVIETAVGGFSGYVISW